ncbi:MAG: Enoyl-CoA hydratase [uncultured Acidimicrobiales bacterium]|uniref:enoyl-CoA hydratase n=1 Tax=uncultured Acidimicrobiales bacterium TaxID=310071 RepID=A0A6J4H0L2_9ACTN|nr:MAG: Enoyl-CoA hydratase [uncultured Acidimicrobiales bacterium]
MSDDRFVSVDRRADGVALVRLDRPKMNALSSAMLEQLEETATELTVDPPGAVVIWGGERIFAAGAEISEFGGPEEARRIGGRFRSSLDAVASIPRAVIAAVSGYALGGGCELALACDFRVVSDRAKLGQPEILLGIIPGGGGTQRLPRLIGSARAKDLILTGRQVDAEEALRIGLADRVVAPDRVLDEALEWAAVLASGPVVAHALAKQAIDNGLSLPLREGVSLEQQLFAEVFATEDAGTGVASFLANGPGKATFRGQ